MRSLTPLLVLGALAAPPALACGCGSSTDAQATAPAATRTATLRIEGMTCASCSVTVKTAAKKLDGLASIDVDVKSGMATVTYDGAAVSAQQIAQQITEAGYATSVVTEEAT